jgi:hypothetical protein
MGNGTDWDLIDSAPTGNYFFTETGKRLTFAPARSPPIRLFTLPRLFTRRREFPEANSFDSVTFQSRVRCPRFLDPEAKRSCQQ